MKSILKTCCLATLGSLLPLAAQESKTTETTERTRNADSSIPGRA